MRKPPRKKVAKPIDIFYRQAPLGPRDPWVVVRSVATEEDVRDELASWHGPRLHHGDLVRVGDWLRVFNAASSTLEFAFSVRSHGDDVSWLRLWEAHDAKADAMLHACKGVAHRKLVAAACDVAASVIGPRGAVQLRVIETARLWAARKATLVQVREAESDLARAITEGHAALGGTETDSVAAVSNAATSASYAAATCLSSLCPQNAAGDAAMLARYAMEQLGLAPCRRADLAELVRKTIPMSVAICANLSLKDPMP